jgi:hypothetical protein
MSGAISPLPTRLHDNFNCYLTAYLNDIHKRLVMGYGPPENSGTKKHRRCVLIYIVPANAKHAECLAFNNRLFINVHY